MRKFRTAIIGLGKQNRETYIPAVLDCNSLQLDSLCDVDERVLGDTASKYNVDGFRTVEILLEKKPPEVAIVAVPHCHYKHIVTLLADKGVHILKEKPFATTRQEALEIDEIIKSRAVYLMMTLQRRYNPIFTAFDQLRKRIGRMYSIEGRYTMNVQRLDLGWRAKRREAGGGALIDMGYHYIDLLIWYFGVPITVTARTTTANREEQDYDVEDTVALQFDFPAEGNSASRLVGNFIISRVYPVKQEHLYVLGTRGIIELNRDRIRRLDTNGNEIESLSRAGHWPSAHVDQVEVFAALVRGERPDLQDSYRDHFKHVAIVEAAYNSDRNGNSCKPSDFLSQEFR